MKTIYWLTHDLRLDDNPALVSASASDGLLIAYCVNPLWFSPYRYHLASMGNHRWNFLQESLTDLNRSLMELKQSLVVLFQKPELALVELIRKHKVDRLVCSRQFGFDEIQSLKKIQLDCPELLVEEVDSYTLFDSGDLPFTIAEIPETYSKFRKKAEKIATQEPVNRPVSLPRSFFEENRPLTRPDWVPAPMATGCNFRGGEEAGVKQLESYFSSALPLSYKLVRNAIDGWDNSSKMSPWLNQGSLSVRRLVQTLSTYERENEANDSTYWLFIELLWR
ncbi:MAG: deoxyribodipyrimidine photo-lyase, partial [Pseudohongiellaceae bacterium]